MRKMAAGIFYFLMFGICGAVSAADLAENGFESAAALMATGKYPEAVGIYRELSAAADAPDQRARALLLEGSALVFSMNRPASALECFEEIVALYPKSPAAADALFNAGVIYYRQQRLDASNHAFSAYLDANPQGVRSASARDWLKSLTGVQENPPIRVLVADGVGRMTIRSESRMVITDADTGALVFPGALSLSLSAEKGSLLIGRQRISSRRIRVGTFDGVLKIHNRKFRGDCLVSAGETGLQVINRVSLEQYLYGIIPRETPSTWPSEALMAQAVASRTYALYIREQNRQRPYDVAASIVSQVYGGMDAEEKSTTAAVDATCGQVVTYNSRPIAAYFHSDSGGYTEDAGFVWDLDAPYLKGAPDKFSSGARGRWRCFLSFRKIAAGLRAAGVSVGAVRKVDVIKKTPSGRVLKLRVLSDTGVSEISGNHFRMNIGPNCVRSTYFQLTLQKGGVLLDGKGYGHGVGLSQWGANRMAAEGYSYGQILAYYYPGTAIASVADVYRRS